MSTPSRAELLRLRAALQGAARRLDEMLATEAGNEHADSGTAVSWRAGTITASSRISQPRAVLDDPQTAYQDLMERWPQEFDVALVITPRNPVWLVKQLTAYGPAGPDGDGTWPPGIRWDPGGRFICLGTTGAGAVVERGAEIATAWATGQLGGPDELVHALLAAGEDQ